MSSTAPSCDKTLEALQTCVYIFTESYKYDGTTPNSLSDKQVAGFRKCMHAFYAKYPNHCSGRAKLSEQ